MLPDILNIPDLTCELQFNTSRSSGPGGQNVNKVNSKVELRFDLSHSQLLTDEQKAILMQKLASKLTNDGWLIVVSQRDRSQLSNKEDAINRFYQLLSKTLTPSKKRKKTNPSRSSVEKRLEGKRIKSEIKQNRRRFED